MNTGQMMITLAAMMLLSLVILRVNNGFLSTNTVLMETKFGVLGVSLATSVIEEATGLAFDENTNGATVSSVGDLSTLGPDGEVYKDNVNPFDDFDDYEGLVYIDSTMPSARFRIACSVDYINTAFPDSFSGTKTWHKKLTVMVTTQSSQDTIEMSTIFSYFYFR